MGKKEPTNEAQSERDGNETEMFSNKTLYLIYITIVYVCVCAVIERLSFMNLCASVFNTAISISFAHIGHLTNVFSSAKCSSIIHKKQT